MDSHVTSISSDLEKALPQPNQVPLASRIWRILRWRLNIGEALSWKTPQKGFNRNCKVRKLGDKQIGYRSLSTFLDSDENFMIYRRFGYLHSRILLRKQDELGKLEADLDEYDDVDENELENPQDSQRLLMSRECDEAACRKEKKGVRTRTEILDEINEKLVEYQDFVLKAQQMVGLGRPAARDYESVEAYIFDKKPLVDEEMDFIYQKEDLITIRHGREVAMLDAFTERMLQIFHCPMLQYLFCTKADRERTTDRNLHYFSKSRKDIFNTSILTIVLMGLLILPIFLLYRLTMQQDLDVTYTASIGILLVFMLLFSAVLSLFTQAKRHEIFGAAAGYCAVLVVFFSNIPAGGDLVS